MSNQDTYNDKYYNGLAHIFSESKHSITELKENYKTNNKEFMQCAKTWDILNKMKNIDEFNTDKAWNKVFGRLEEEGLVKGKTKVIPIKRIMAVAASVILLVGLFVIAKQNILNTNVTVTNKTESSQKVLLPDGSVVFLNKMASITFPKKFNKEKREVSFKGEAFFDIYRNPAQPFVINVNDAQVRVLGTSFNIYEGVNQNVEVTVKSGRVEFCDCHKSGNTIILSKGEKGTLNKQRLVKSVNKNENYLAWMNKKLVFKAQPLSRVINDINAAYHSNISIGADELNNMVITTTFDSLSLNEVLKSLSLTLNIKIDQSKENTILVKH